ncbi:PREDICTED: putative aspartate aminotransferase, cytoplasmic 2 [Gekko japonicus]|uniref:aspartate transaminase n=1 Tax=Gekko japonicus TaxID=146911 RepID=A0ABM1JRG0_GEKJA|nr:PREDICTED: putative aspartate aminotransferase, cytoplasmic 2 [Gekko japonicus]
MGTLSVFLDVPLVKKADIPLDYYGEDPHPQKVLLGHAGCQTDAGEAWIPPVVQRILLQISQDPTLNHEYLPELGIYEYTRAATELAIGKESRALLENRAGGVHTIGGTGALWIGAEFLCRWYKPRFSTPTALYIAKPQLDSLGCIFQVAGFTDIRPYHYWKPVSLTLKTLWGHHKLANAPTGSIVFLHAPEEIGLKPKEWEAVAATMEKKQLFPFFNIESQGLASGNLDRDAWALQHFVGQGFELLCAQSFSRTFGLYDELAGNLIVVTKNNETLIRIQSQLGRQICTTWWCPSSLGARVIGTVLNSPALLYEWKLSLRMVVERIMLIREKLKEKLRILGTPGSWEHLTAQSGMCSFIGLQSSQVEFLAKHKHIYLFENQQINICSINSKNLDYVAQSIHEAVLATSLGDYNLDLEGVDRS